MSIDTQTDVKRAEDIAAGAVSGVSLRLGKSDDALIEEGYYDELFTPVALKVLASAPESSVD